MDQGGALPIVLFTPPWRMIIAKELDAPLVVLFRLFNGQKVFFMQSGRHVFSFTCFAAKNEIQIDGLNKQQADEIASKVIAEALRIQAKYSRYKADSVTSLINTNAGGEAVELDSETAMLLHYADLAYQTSAGAFDITSGVLRKAWDFKQPRVPSTQELAPLLALVGWQMVERQQHKLRLPLPGMELDFGAIGKEYAVDRCSELALQLGAEHCCVNFAGDLRVTGPRADGRAWNIGIQHPRNKERTIASIPLSAGALATSGDYERFFELAGERYCHILDPRSGEPVRHFQSVSVLADTCLNAGTLATITMLLGQESYEHILLPGKINFLIVDREGSLKKAA